MLRSSSHRHVQSPRPPRRWFGVTALLLAFLAACDWNAATAVPATPPDIRQYVAGEAAHALGADGRFPLPAAVAPPGERIITPERAGELALGYVRGFGPFFVDRWSREHGRRIDLESLRVSPRILYLQTPYGPFPPGYMPAWRKFYGPHFLVTLEAGGAQALSIAVSAYATEVVIDRFGRALPPGDGNGGEFSSYGISLDSTRLASPDPEWAVDFVGRRLGARTILVPQPIHQLSPVSPLVPLWRLRLDREVPVRTANGARRMRIPELYVNRERRMFVPAEVQPTEQQTTAVRLGAGREERPVPVVVQIRSGVVTAFEEVVADQPDGES